MPNKQKQVTEQTTKRNACTAVSYTDALCWYHANQDLNLSMWEAKQTFQKNGTEKLASYSFHWHIQSNSKD